MSELSSGFERCEESCQLAGPGLSCRAEKLRYLSHAEFEVSRDACRLSRSPDPDCPTACFVQVSRLFLVQEIGPDHNDMAARLEARCAVCLQTFLDGFQLRVAAPFLLDQEIFGAARVLGCVQKGFPIRVSFPEQDRISFA